MWPGKQKSTSVRPAGSLSGSVLPGWRQAGQGPASCSPEFCREMGAQTQGQLMAKHMEGWGGTRRGAWAILGHCRPAELAGRDGPEQGAWEAEAKLAAVGTTTQPDKLGIQIDTVPESGSEALGLPNISKSKYSLPKIPNIKKETEQRKIKRQQKRKQGNQGT